MLIAFVGTFALLDQIGAFEGVIKPTFFCMFTNISNVAVVAYFWAYVIRFLIRGRKNLQGPMGSADFDTRTPWLPKLKYALTLAITVTCLIAHFMLDGGMVFMNGEFHWQMLVLHYIVPIGTVLDWLIFDLHGHMGKFDPLYWPAFPLLYLVYTIILVEGFGIYAHEGSRWPYPFIDVDANGLPTVIITCIVLVAIFVALGYVYVAIDKQLAKREKVK